MSVLGTRAELIKLARDFQREPESLAQLTGLGVDNLARLRHLCSDQLFKRYQPMYRRVAAASGLVPAKLAVTIGEKVFGPYLGGRIGSQLETDRAIKFAELASVEFLAEICETIDPRRVLAIIHGMPLERVVAVGNILIAARDYITLGKFVDAVTDVQIRAMLEVIEDPEVLLHTAFYTEGKQRLEDIVHLVSDEKLKAIILSSVQSGHFPEALALMSHVGEESEVRLVNLAADLGEPVLNELVRLANDEGLWPDILPLVLKMAPRNISKVMAVPGILNDGVLGRLVQAVEACGLWDEVVPVMVRCDYPVLDAFISVTTQEGVWGDVLPLVFKLSPEESARLIETPALCETNHLSAMLRAVHAQNAWDRVIPMLTQTSREIRAALVGVKFLYEPDTMWCLFDAVMRIEAQELLFSMLELMSAQEKNDALTAVFSAVNDAQTHAELFAMLNKTRQEDQALLAEAVMQVDAAVVGQIMARAAEVPGATETWLYQQLQEQTGTG